MSESQSVSTGATNRKIYGRGYYDGVRAALAGKTSKKEIDVSMSYARFSEMYQGMTSASKKVYEAVPIGVEWSKNQINSECHRLQYNMDRRIVDGCLYTLKSAGLIVEPSSGFFIRAAVKDRQEKKVIEPTENQEKQRKDPAMTAVKTQKEVTSSGNTSSAISKLGEISQRAIQISEKLRELANDIETAALEIDNEAAAQSDETKKLMQLKQILQSLG